MSPCVSFCNRPRNQKQFADGPQRGVDVNKATILCRLVSQCRRVYEIEIHKGPGINSSTVDSGFVTFPGREQHVDWADCRQTTSIYCNCSTIGTRTISMKC